MFDRSNRRIAFQASAVALALAAFTAPVAVMAQAATYRFDIPAQDLGSALRAFGQMSRQQVVFDGELVRGKTSAAVAGTFTADEGLRRLLSGTGLVARRGASGVLVIGRADATSVDANVASLADVVVTGSRITGAPPTAPIHVVTRTEIDRSGYGTVGDVIASLPENFGGGQQPGNLAAGGVNQNITNGSTVNLRGLGADASLTLVNGRRMAADGYGQAADISAIPLPAVQRVEIVTDGSSAIYGSDAVAGVANFILRKDYDGVDLSARFGVSTQGDGFEQTYSTLAGTAGENGFALLNVEYSKQEAIRAEDREFTNTAPPKVDLSRPQERTSVFLSAGREFTDRISANLDALWSEREVQYTYQTRRAGSAQSIATETPAYVVAGDIQIDLQADWNLRVNATTSASRSDQLTTTPTTVSHTRYRNDTQSGEVILEGPVLRLPSGDLKVAVGGGLRDERYRGDSRTGTFRISGSHDVRYLFGEAFVPLVPASDNRPGLNALDLSVSGRYEDYSDYGSTSTPKVGLRYVPFRGLTVRSTWGKSFKAPTFTQEGTALGVLITQASVIGYPGPGTVLYATGGSGDLLPERSTSWTFGGDYTPSHMPSMTIGATYFNIDYTDRVVTPITPASAALANPAFAPFVTLDPSAADQAALLAEAGTVVNQSGSAYDPNTVVAIVLNRYANASSQTVEGIDLSYRQDFTLPIGELSAFANATWIDVRQQTLPTLPAVQLSGTIFQIPEYRVRAGLSWECGNISTTGIVNYQSGSTDTGVVPTHDIDSLTTIDATLAYRFSASTGPLAGTSAVLSVTNLLDEDPPYAASPAALHDGIFFDSTNSSAIGRFVALTLRKQF